MISCSARLEIIPFDAIIHFSSSASRSVLAFLATIADLAASIPTSVMMPNTSTALAAMAVSKTLNQGCSTAPCAIYAIQCDSANHRASSLGQSVVSPRTNCVLSQFPYNLNNDNSEHWPKRFFGIVFEPFEKFAHVVHASTLPHAKPHSLARMIHPVKGSIWDRNPNGPTPEFRGTRAAQAIGN